MSDGYTFSIDWDNDGGFTDPNDDVSGDVLDRGITIQSGRDQARTLSPGRVGTAGFDLCNVSRIYSPENMTSPIQSGLVPGRPASISAEFESTLYPLFRGRVDDFRLSVDRSDRSASFDLLDGLADLREATLSTAVYFGLRTGEIVNRILDEIGWTAGRDIDAGGSFTHFWWAEGQSAYDAIQDVVAGEGPPAIAYIAGDGSFTFRDRHHRFVNARSKNVQAVYVSSLTGCTTGVAITGVPVTGSPVTGLTYTAPFEYEHGWRNIVNNVEQTVDERTADGEPVEVWRYDTPFVLSAGQTRTFKVTSSEPFVDAVIPTLSGDDPDVDRTIIVASGLGITFDRTSGQSLTMVVSLLGAGVTQINRIRVRAVPLDESGASSTVTAMDTTSIAANGIKSFGGDIPLVTVNDVAAVAEIIVSEFGTRSQTISMRVPPKDATHLREILGRSVSDKIQIRNEELGMDRPFFIEQTQHLISRTSFESCELPVHHVTFGCTVDKSQINTNPFTFDVVGKGFDQGFFGGVQVNDPNTLWIWDVQSEFDMDTFGV